MANNLKVRHLFMAALAVIFGVFLNLCHRAITYNKQAPQDEVVSDHTSVKTNIDTTKKSLLPVNSYEVVHDTVWPTLEIDTQAILAEYFAYKTYHRKYSDTNCIITLTDTVYRNVLYPGILDVTTFSKTKIIETVVTKYKSPRIRIDLGAQITNKGAAVTMGWGFYRKNYSYSVGPIIGQYRGVYIQASKSIN